MNYQELIRLGWLVHPVSGEFRDISQREAMERYAHGQRVFVRRPGSREAFEVRSNSVVSDSLPVAFCAPLT